MTVWKEPVHFQWDAGNQEKNWQKHRVTHVECEEAFFDPHKRVLPLASAKAAEVRHLLIGGTATGRWLFVVFTLRGHAVRVISARDLNQKERRLYEEAT
jgi:uncharacterized DUF497 family protein